MAIGPVVTRGFGTFGNVNLVVTRGYVASSTPPPVVVATATQGSGGGYHYHPKDKALDWRVRDKREIERVLAELGEHPETRERVVEIREAHTKPLSRAQKAQEARKPPEQRKAPEFDVAALMRDMEDTAWILKAYDQLMLQQLHARRRDEDDAAFMLLM